MIELDKFEGRVLGFFEVDCTVAQTVGDKQIVVNTPRLHSFIYCDELPENKASGMLEIHNLESDAGASTLIKEISDKKDLHSILEEPLTRSLSSIGSLVCHGLIPGDLSFGRSFFPSHIMYWKEWIKARAIYTDSFFLKTSQVSVADSEKGYLEEVFDLSSKKSIGNINLFSRIVGPVILAKNEVNDYFQFDPN